MAADGTLVFPHLGPEGGEAARLDLASGRLTPVQTTWRRKPVTLDRRALALVVGYKDHVDLVFERLNGWRAAGVPLFARGAWGAASQPADLLAALEAEVERRAPRDGKDVVALLHAQVRHLQREPDALTTSPLARKLTGTFDRVMKNLS